MTNPRPTIEEQIEALAALRKFAMSAPFGVTHTEAQEAVFAINILDNADLFADLDEKDFELNQCGDTSAGLPEPPCDLDKPCPVHEDTPIGLPELKPGEEARPDFSDTHPRAARELGDVIRGSGGQEDQS